MVDSLSNQLYESCSLPPPWQRAAGAASRLGAGRAASTIKCANIVRTRKRASRTITYSGYGETTAPLLKRLHWLSLPERVDYRLAQLVFKSVQGLAQITCARCFSLKHAIERQRRHLRTKSTNQNLQELKAVTGAKKL